MTDVPNHVSKQQPHLTTIIIVISLEHFTLRTFWSYLPKHPHVCFLRVSASLLEKDLNKDGMAQPGHAAISKQTKQLQRHRLAICSRNTRRWAITLRTIIKSKLFSILNFYRSLNVYVCRKPTFTDTVIHLILKTPLNTNLQPTDFL